MPSTGYALIVILVVAAVTFGIRLLPFALFGGKRPAPKYVLYLGRALPPAIMGMLIVYCLKDVNVAASPFGLPELIGVAVTAGLQLWKRNGLISIFTGTAVYVILVQFVFI
jgi:branched-subunit amino acid transport protein AzlD